MIDPHHYTLARRARARGNTWCASDALVFAAEGRVAAARAAVESTTAHQRDLTSRLQALPVGGARHREAVLVAELARSARDCRRAEASLQAAITARNVLSRTPTTPARVPRTRLGVAA